MLFSDSLPDLGLQIADFRTTDDHKMVAPSPELYDTVGTMMARQEWMRGYFISESYAPIGYIGSFSGKPLNEDTIAELVEALHVTVLDEVYKNEDNLTDWMKSVPKFTPVDISEEAFNKYLELCAWAKNPQVCDAFQIECISAFDFMRLRNFKF